MIPVIKNTDSDRLVMDQDLRGPSRRLALSGYVVTKFGKII